MWFKVEKFSTLLLSSFKLRIYLQYGRHDTRANQ